MKTLSFASHASASVNFKIDVVGKNGRVVKRLPKRRNLILNTGLDAIGAQTCDWKSATNNVAVGTGALTVKRASGATTITPTAGTIVASAGFFLAADVGRVLKLNSGEEYLISGFTSATQVASLNLTSAAASAGTVHYTSLAGLVTETERSSTVAPGGTRVSTYDAGLKTWTHTVILLTPVLAVPRVYSEIGWSWAGSIGNPLFGCAPIAPTVSLGVGQRLRVTITVVVKPSPMVSTPVNVGLAVGNASNELTGNDAGRPFVNSVQLGTASNAIAAPSTSSSPAMGTVITAGTQTFSGYSNGTYKRTLTFQFADSLGAINANCLRISYGQQVANIVCDWRILFTSTLVKTANDRVDGTFEFSWGRELVN